MIVVIGLWTNGRSSLVITSGWIPSSARSTEGIGYTQWRAERVFALVPAQAFVAQWLSSFQKFPPRQKPASFGIDQVMEKLMSAGHSSR